MNSSDVARKPIIFGVVNQKAFNIVAVYLIIKLLVKYRPYAAQKTSCVFSPEAFKASKSTSSLGVLFTILLSDAVYTRWIVGSSYAVGGRGLAEQPDRGY